MVAGGHYPCCQDNTQTGATLLVTQMLGIAFLSRDLAGLLKLQKINKKTKKEPDASGSFKMLSEDDHRNSCLYCSICKENMQVILRIANEILQLTEVRTLLGP